MRAWIECAYLYAMAAIILPAAAALDLLEWARGR
jgi:hypothetical protein